ncbi:MAG TPA: hypothetical protein VGQ53_15110 [Chitinophagaceae bacterium]|jgi:hypothetical protein|nr:hypothetical protein [Chitinophagaceae bacterium]
MPVINENSLHVFKAIRTDKNVRTSIVGLCLAVIGFVLNLVAYYPGFMSPDSLDVYSQSISHHYTDSHPPIMAGLWSIFNSLYKGSAIMLLFQLGLFWSSFYLLATTWFSSRRNQIFFFVGLLLAPFIQNFLGYIIGDAQMALSWLFGFSIIARAEYEKRRMTVPEAVFCFLFIFYGSLVRINAVPGALPLFYLYFHSLLKRTKRWSVVAATLVSLCLVIGCQVFSNHILRSEKKYPEYKLYLQDLSGIYVKTGKNYFPSFIRDHRGFDTNYLKSNFTTATIDNLYYGPGISFPPLNESTKGIIHRAWTNSILDNPGIYLQNRWDGFLYFLHVKKRSWLVVLHAEVSPNNLGITFKRNFISDLFLEPIRFQSWMVYMKPWFWLIVNVVILVLAVFIYDPVIKRSVTVLAVSSFLYLAAEFFIIPVDTDFRYFYWNCLSLFVSAAFLLKSRGFKRA